MLSGAGFIYIRRPKEDADALEPPGRVSREANVIFEGPRGPSGLEEVAGAQGGKRVRLEAGHGECGQSRDRDTTRSVATRE